MSHPMVPIPVHFNVGPVKRTPNARITCGTKIGAQAPSSDLYKDPEVKAAVDNVVQKTKDAQAAVDDYSKAQAAYIKAREALGLVVAGWDITFDVLVSTAGKHCTSGADGAALGMPLRDAVSHALAIPLGVLLKQDFKKHLLRIHVQRAPGMKTAVVQVSRDPITATSWEELGGEGLVREIPSPAPGIWYARAAHKRARATSDFTAPATLVVK
jgi:hypothetical protein